MSECNFCVVIQQIGESTYYFNYNTLDECKNLVSILDRGKSGCSIKIMQKKIVQREQWETIL